MSYRIQLPGIMFMFLSDWPILDHTEGSQYYLHDGIFMELQFFLFFFYLNTFVFTYLIIISDW